MTKVVKPDELEKSDERLREQMKKLELSPPEGRKTFIYYKSHHVFYIAYESCMSIVDCLLPSEQRLEVGRRPRALSTHHSKTR